MTTTMTNHKNTRETFLNRLVVKLKRFMKIEYLNNDNLSDLTINYHCALLPHAMRI